MSAVPDPAAIAKLANEFFAALPGAAAVASRTRVYHRLRPTSEWRFPSHRRGCSGFSERDVFFPRCAGPRNSGHPSPPLQSPASALNESDFRAIAASLSGALPSYRPTQAATPPGRCPALPRRRLRLKGRPWATSPQIPRAEMILSPEFPQSRRHHQRLPQVDLIWQRRLRARRDRFRHSRKQDFGQWGGRTTDDFRRSE